MNDIGRGDIAKLLDMIEDENGPVMADRTLAYLGRVFAWHAARDDKFRSADRPGYVSDQSKGTGSIAHPER